MKYTKPMIILIVLLGIFMIGSVSASENITDFSQTDSSDLEAEIEAADYLNETEKSASNEIAEDINITFDEQMWENDLGNITVQLPETANGTFCLKIGTLEVYNQTITNKTLTIPVQLPKPLYPYIIENIYPPRDCTYYKVTAFYNGINLDINKTLTVMKFSPEYEYWWGISDEILQYDPEFWGTILFPRSANGIVEIYVDDKLLNKTVVKGPFVYYDANNITGLPLGNHTMRLVYYNDTYYHDANKTIAFEVVNVKISVPTNIYIGHDDCLTVDVLENTSGKVNIYVDNVLVYKGKTDKYGSFLLSLEGYLKHNSSEVKVEFVGKHYSRQKTVPVNITYDFGYEDGGSFFIYGEENIIEMILPDTLNNSILTVTINGTKYGFTHPKQYMNNIVEVDISKLDVGNYTIVISYPGDDKFEARTESYNFSVSYSVMYPYDIEFKDGSVAYLNLPADANGNLTVYVNGVAYKSVRLNKGKASVKLSSLIPGKYNLSAQYSGSDYNVSNSNATIEVHPKFTVNYFFTAGQDKSVTVEVPEDCKGYVLFYIDAVEYNVTIKNGKAKFSFKNLKAGKHIVYIEYYGANGFKCEDDNLITIYKPKLKIVSAKITRKYVNVKVKVLDNRKKAIKNAKVTFKIKGKTIKAKTNKKGIAKIKGKVNLKAKKYTIKAAYNGGKITKKIRVKA